MSSLPHPSLEPRGIDPQSSEVRIIAVMGVIFGTLGLSCLPFNFGEWITAGWPIQGSKTTIMDLWCFASTFIGLGLSAILLLSSLAAYRFAWWGRGGLLVWAWGSLVYGAVGLYFWVRFFLPSLRNHYTEMHGPDEVAGPIAWIIGTSFAAIALWYLTRPSVRAVFELARPDDANTN